MKTKAGTSSTEKYRENVRKTLNGGIGKERKEESACRIYSWKVVQREMFLHAFKRVYANDWLDEGGPSDDKLEEIEQSVVGRTKSDIKRLILHNMSKIKVHNASTDGPIDKWLELVDALSPEKLDLEKQLGYVMVVATEEPVVEPPQEQNNEMPTPDYTKIYKYLSCAMANKPLPPLSPIDSLVVEDAMQSLAYQIQCLNDDDLRHSLRKVYLHLAKRPTQEQETDYEEIRKNLLHNASIFNPLGLNAQAIVPAVPE